MLELRAFEAWRRVANHARRPRSAVASRRSAGARSGAFADRFARDAGAREPTSTPRCLPTWRSTPRPRRSRRWVPASTSRIAGSFAPIRSRWSSGATMHGSTATCTISTKRSATTLLALLNAHFAGDGLVFAAPRADAWFAMSDGAARGRHRCPSSMRRAGRCASCCPRAPTLRAGGAGSPKRRCCCTSMRSPLVRRPVNALWFSGGGVLPDVARIPSVHATLPRAGRHGDVLRGIARARGDDATLPATAATRCSQRDVAKRSSCVLRPRDPRAMRWRAHRATSSPRRSTRSSAGACRPSS